MAPAEDHFFNVYRLVRARELTAARLEVLRESLAEIMGDADVKSIAMAAEDVTAAVYQYGIGMMFAHVFSLVEILFFGRVGGSNFAEYNKLTDNSDTTTGAKLRNLAVTMSHVQCVTDGGV